MRKNLGIMGMMAAMMGMGKATESANKSAQDLNESMNQPMRFFPDNGIKPKQYGLFIATRQSNIVKRKRRSKVAFG